MIVWVLFLILGALLGNVLAETSAGNIADAQEGMAESSWPKKPGHETSSLSGKMTDFKQIDMRSYEKGRSFQNSRVYEDRKESSLVGTPLWAQGSSSSYQGKESTWSGRENSALDGVSHRDYSASRESSWQKKEDVETRKTMERKEGPDWISRTSPKFQGKDGSLAMYDGRLTQVRETMLKEDSSVKRDLGAGRKEMFDPSEVQKILEGKGRTTDPKQPSPVEVPVRAGSGSAFQPVVADSSPSLR
jgi:hypothetical protein